MILARKGEVVSCANGHPICDVVKDVESVGPIRSKSFGNWRIGKSPLPGDLIGICHICGAFYIAGAWVVGERYGETSSLDRKGKLIHIGNEWR
jgi:hypothetical protein